MMKTARIVKSELQSSYDLYNSKVNDYLELKVKCHESDNDNDHSSAVLMEQNAILKEVKAVSIELEAIAASVGSVSAGRKVTSVDTIIKMEKLKCPKFSEHPRDFGQFKRDFNQIINVPGRSDVEVGSNLKGCHP